MTFSASRVLVVEDDEPIRDCVAQLLVDEGYIVIGVEDGETALDLLRQVGQDQPDVILLDMRMPAMDGWQFAAGYRKLPVRHASIVAMTAATEIATRAARERPDGICAVLPKPFDLDELLALVAQFQTQRHRMAA